MSPRRHGIALRHALALGGASACWGLGAVATKGLIAEVPPLPMLVAQLVGSVAFLWAAVLATRTRVPFDRSALRAASSGLLEPGLAYTLGLLGLALTTASSASLIYATETPMIVVIAWLFLGERLGVRTLLLAALAGLGVGLLMLPDLLGVGGGSILGDVLMVGSTLVAAVYVTVSRHLVSGVAPLPLVTLQQSVGLLWAVAALGVGRAAGWVPSSGSLPAGTLLLCGATGIVQYGLAFWLYLYGLRHVSASRAGLFLTLIPVFGVASAAVLLGERLSLAQWLGAAVVILVVRAMVREEGRARAEAPAPAEAS